MIEVDDIMLSPKADLIDTMPLVTYPKLEILFIAAS